MSDARPLVVAVRCALSQRLPSPHALTTRVRTLPQVDCLSEQASLIRDVLGNEADFAGVGYGWPRSDMRLLDRAAVVVMRSLHELSGGVASHLGTAAAVVLTAPWPGAAEEELATELRVRRVLRATPADALAAERADTELALMLSLVRRTHDLQRELHRGAWLPPHAAYRGARRCASLTVGLVGLDECTAGVASRCAAFGMRVLYVHPLPCASADAGSAHAEEDAALEAAAAAAGAVAAPSLDSLLSSADVIALHSRPEAGVVLGAEQLGPSRLRGGQFVVHTGSSGLDSFALKKALHAGLLTGAALDAPDTDAFLEAASRETRGLLLTQRAAAHSEDAATEAAAPAALAALAVIRGDA